MYIKDHQVYYQTIEKGLSNIVDDSDFQQEKKAKILNMQETLTNEPYEEFRTHVYRGVDCHEKAATL